MRKFALLLLANRRRPDYKLLGSYSIRWDLGYDWVRSDNLIARFESYYGSRANLVI